MEIFITLLIGVALGGVGMRIHMMKKGYHLVCPADGEGHSH